MTGLMRQGDDDSTSHLLAQTLRNLSEGITGIAASERKDLYLSIGYLLQRLRSGRFLETLKEEWEGYREKGRIKDDYIDTEQHAECLQEILDFIDMESPDHIRFNAMKHVLLNAATELMSSRDSVLPQQYMSICRKLSAGEVLVLQATYQLAQDGEQLEEHASAANWLQRVASTSPLRFRELVEYHERALMEKRLLSGRSGRGGNVVEKTSHYRLTDLGHEVCRFMQEYEVPVTNSMSE